MSLPSPSSLINLRSWRTWLLAAVAVVQGAQYVLHPAFPLAQPAYSAFEPLGAGGWRLIGLALLFVGVWIALANDTFDVAGHLVAGAVYMALSACQAASGVVPAVLLLPLGLHAGEVVAWILARRRRRRS